MCALSEILHEREERSKLGILRSVGARHLIEDVANDLLILSPAHDRLRASHIRKVLLDLLDQSQFIFGELRHLLRTSRIFSSLLSGDPLRLGLRRCCGLSRCGLWVRTLDQGRQPRDKILIGGFCGSLRGDTLGFDLLSGLFDNRIYRRRRGDSRSCFRCDTLSFNLLGSLLDDRRGLDIRWRDCLAGIVSLRDLIEGRFEVVS